VSGHYSDRMTPHEMIDYVRTQRAGVISTLGEDGAPQSAYLAITATGTGDLVFDAKPGSRKIANLRRDARIAVVIGGADGTTLQAEGRAEVLAGAESTAFGDEYLRTFPEYEDSVRGGGVVIVRVRLDWARFGDFRGAEGVVAEVELEG
jgi:hypothetical protein